MTTTHGFGTWTLIVSRNFPTAGLAGYQLDHTKTDVTPGRVMLLLMRLARRIPTKNSRFLRTNTLMTSLLLAIRILVKDHQHPNLLQSARHYVEL
jgi:hypothetical protein